MRVERIGDCTLYLGDCREVLPTLQRPAAVISDPPYGMKAGTDSGRFSGGTMTHRIRRKEGRSWPAVIGDDKEFDPSHLVGAADIVLLWGFNHFPAHCTPGTSLVWLKRADNAFGTFLSDGELAWLNKGRGFYAFRDFSGHMEASSGHRYHPTQKPVSLMRWCIQRAKVPLGGIILDPYMGSGSTGVAAVNEGYPFVGVEVVPEYFDAACKRIEAAYKQPDLFVSGQEQKPTQEALL
jgi:DNA modification methylase